MAVAKLTLSLNKKAIAAAKQYSARHKLSLSKLIERYFNSFSGKNGGFLPIVSRLLGILPEGASVLEHKRYLEKKYRV